MTGKKIIRAEDYIPERTEHKDSGDTLSDSVGMSRDKIMLLNMFGEFPNYSDERFENIWQEFIDADPAEIVAYCLEKGVDVRCKDGIPVAGWYDIATMLKAIDTGLLVKIEKT